MSEIFFFGEWIAQRRKTLDMTQRDFAAQTNCSLATIKKIETDERRPSRELAEAFAGVLCIPAEKIAIFVECARGLRSAGVLVSIEHEAAEKNEQRPASPIVNLPTPSTPFIGRDAELSQIAGSLDDETCRLLTLVGPGGVGKTRLAYQAAAHTNTFQSGVYVVPLAGINTVDNLLPTIAEHLKLTFQNGDPRVQMLNFLQQKRLLLVLDNLEHLLDGVGLLADILAATPGVKILVTSRERLNLSGEWLFPVSGLLFPTDINQLNQVEFSAMTLFENCARRVLPSFCLENQLAATIHVCQLVEGLPLAIELAAGWVRQMSCEQIAAQIQHDLNFLSAGRRDVPERHRSISALFEHSWRMLSPEEQTILMRLSVFRGGFELEAAQQITGASLLTLSTLVDKSLVESSPSGRYNLHELIRQYAESRLVDAGKVADTHTPHLEYYADWAISLEVEFHNGEQINTARRIKTEYNNFQAALAWAFSEGDPEKGLRLTGALWCYWFRWGGNWDEGYKWIELGLGQTEGVTPVRAEAYANASTLAGLIGKMQISLDYMQKSFELSQALNLPHGMVRYVMGMSYYIEDYAVIVAKFDEAIALLRDLGPSYMLSTALFLYGDRARVQGDLDRAQSLYNEALLITRVDQDWQMSMAILVKLARLTALKGDYQNARYFYIEGIDIARQMDNHVGLDEYLIYSGKLALYQGDYEAAERHLIEALSLVEKHNIGEKTQAFYLMAELALHRSEFHDAARLLTDSLTMTLRQAEWHLNLTNPEFNTDRLIIAGKLACALGDHAQAAWVLSAGEAIRACSSYLLDPLPHAEYEKAIHDVRAALGSSTFDRLWQDGQSLNQAAALGRAIEYLQDVLVKGYP